MSHIPPFRCGFKPTKAIKKTSADKTNVLQGRNWLFTLNNPKEDEVPEEILSPFKYLIYQYEKGKEGTDHIQGYVCFTTNKRLASLKKLIARAHWDYRRGTHDQAVKYCSKQETKVRGPFEFGDVPKAGKRNDLENLRTDLCAGKSMLDIADSHFGSFLRFERSIRSYRTLTTQPRNFKSWVYVLYGPTGTGKSHFVSERHKHNPSELYWFSPQKDAKWFDKYDPTIHNAIVFDEFYGQLPWSFMLRITDRYPMEVETKGSVSVPFTCKYIYFTSNKHPRDWYSKMLDKYDTLERRFENVVFCPMLGVKDVEKGPPICPIPVPDLSSYVKSTTSDLVKLRVLTPPEIPTVKPILQRVPTVVIDYSDEESPIEVLKRAAAVVDQCETENESESTSF